MAVTIAQIAERTSLSQATISRVLNGKGLDFISVATRQRVLKAAQELGYNPNRVARGLASGKSQVIGLWIRNPAAPYYSRILRQVEELASEHGYETILAGFQDRGAIDPQRAARADRLWGGWPVDGVLAMDVRWLAEACRQSCAHRHMPLVGMGSDYAADHDFVAFDAETGVRQAVTHLVEIGCRRIAHLSGGVSIEHVRIGRAGVYERVVTAAGLTPIFITAQDESRSRSRQAVREYCQAHEPPDGLFCLNDDMAIGAYRGLRDAGLGVPQDVALVGCDGIEDVEYLDPPLTTIVQPIDELCRAAWATLTERMANPDTPQRRIMLSPYLVQRESTQRNGTH